MHTSKSCNHSSRTTHNAIIVLQVPISSRALSAEYLLGRVPACTQVLKLCRALSAECTQGPECIVQSAISVQLIQVHGSKSFKPILPHTCPAHAVLQTAKAARSRPHAPWRPLWSNSQASCSRRRLRRARPHADSRHAAEETPDAWAARPAPSSSRSLIARSIAT